VDIHIISSSSSPVPLNSKTLYLNFVNINLIACHCHPAGPRPLPVSVRPCLPSSSPPPTAVDAPGRSSLSAAALAILPAREFLLSRRPHRPTIRSNIMSHITFKMCQFILIIHLRDHHYDFDLDIVLVWSCYGVLRLTYTTYQNSCPTDHFFGRLLMSQDISPTWIVLLESIYRIIQVFFLHFSHVSR